MPVTRRMLVALVLLTLVALSHAQALPREVRMKLIDAVVGINPVDPETDKFADQAGSGTIISPDGYILTNYHVVGDLDAREHYEWHGIFVTSSNAADRPPQLTYWAQYVSGNATHDLALLKIKEYRDGSPVPDTLTFPAIPVGNSNDLVLGDTLMVVGYPQVSGATITFTSGIMGGWLGENMLEGGKQWIKTDARIARGNSGGAAINEKGELVAIPTRMVHVIDAKESIHEEELYLRPVNLAWELFGLAGVRVQVGSATQPEVVTNPETSDDDTTSDMPETAPYTAIAVGSTVSGTIKGATEESVLYHGYRVDVPAHASHLAIQVDSQGHDLDLAVKFGSELSSWNEGEVDYSDFTEGANPSYTVSNPPAGPLYFEVINPITGKPGNYSVTVTTGAPGTEAETPSIPGSHAPTGSGTVGQLLLNEVVSGNLLDEDEDYSTYHTYYIDVPGGTQQLIITMEATDDLDLFVKFGEEIKSYSAQAEGGDWDYADVTTAPDARLVIAQPQPGRWYIDVAHMTGTTAGSEYMLKATIQ